MWSLPVLLAAGVPEALARRMEEGRITEELLTHVVGNVMGILPASMPLRQYPADAVQDMLDAWPQVLGQVEKEMEDLPF